jgi:hypothetical protein
MSDDLLDVKIALAKLVASICAPINKGTPPRWLSSIIADTCFTQVASIPTRLSGHCA